MGTSNSTLCANGNVKSIGKCGNPSLLSAFSRKTNFWDVNKSSRQHNEGRARPPWASLSWSPRTWMDQGLEVESSNKHTVVMSSCWGPLIDFLDSPKKSSLEKHPSKVHAFHQYCKNQPSCQSSNGSWWKCWSRSITITTSLGSSCKQLESLYPRSTYKTFHETDETWQDEVWIYAMYQTVNAVSYSNHAMTRW